MDLAGRAIKHITYPLWVYKNRSSRLKWLRAFERWQFLPGSRLREMQWTRLKRILEHAYNSCPFYRKRLEWLNIKPTDIRSWGDFTRNVPLLSKSDIQDNLCDLVSRSYSEDELIRDMTGGSTGSPLVFYYTKDRLDSREAATTRHRRWAGWEIGDKVAALWGSRRDIQHPRTIKSRIRQFLISRYFLLDASAITEDKMLDFAQELRVFRPKIIQGYANTLYLFARFLKSNNINGIRPKGIISSAEVLLPENRTFIESIFGCSVFDLYGSREVMLIASECESHRGMHINADSLYVEFVRDGLPAQDNQYGEIVITDLLNYGMPLIRYRIGDVGRALERVCDCGRGLPLMEIAQGRVTEFILTPDRRIVSGVTLATYVITNVPGIKQVQLTQERIDLLRVKLVRGVGYGQHSQTTLLEKLKSFLGPNMRFEFEFAENITKESSGKYRFSISKVFRGFINKDTIE